MKHIHTDKAPKAVGPYSQAVSHGSMLYCSGQVAIDPESGILIAGEIEAETRLVLQNLEAVLNEGGATRASVVKCTVFVRDMDMYTRINGVYEAFFGVSAPPARELVEVSRLPKDANVEISAIAVVVNL